MSSYKKSSGTSSTTCTSEFYSHRRKHVKNKVVHENDASTLYLDFSNQSTAAKRTSDTLTASTSTGSLRSLSSAKNLISLSLLQEKEHTEKESANRSSRNVGSSSSRKRNLPNSSSVGLRLSELTTLSASSQCDDDSYDDNDDESTGSNAAVDDGNASFMSGRTMFHKIANRIKIASSTSTNNLAAIAELSNDLADEIETQQHGSNYFKNRMSIRVRRASDLLFSSHHRKGLEDVEEDEHADSQL